MAGLTAVAVTFLATRLDPYSHAVGDYVLAHPELSATASRLWELPLMPWTDLNNTVVLGSFLIGLGALIPIFVLTFPVFHFIASTGTGSNAGETMEAMPRDVRHIDGNEVVMVDHGHSPVSHPHHGTAYRGHSDSHVRVDHVTTDDAIDFVESPDDQPLPLGDDSAQDHSGQVAVETRIDVIRMKDYRADDPARPTHDDPSIDDPSNEQPMDEALNYLLRQLRDSQQRKAA